MARSFGSRVLHFDFCEVKGKDKSYQLRFMNLSPWSSHLNGNEDTQPGTALIRKNVDPDQPFKTFRRRLVGYDNVPDLIYAMSLDSDLEGAARGLVMTSGSRSASAFQSAFETFVQTWAGVADVDPSSRGMPLTPVAPCAAISLRGRLQLIDGGFADSLRFVRTFICNKP